MSQDTGYPPPTRMSASGDATNETEPSSSAQVAREQAGEVGHSVQEAGQHVAQTAVEQAREVASETGRQARDLLAETRTQLRDQAQSQQQRAVDGLRALADELQQMAEKGGQSGSVATELAHNAADRVHGLARWLDQRSPGAMVEEVRSFARRRPGAFLMGAAFAGVIAGRLTRGAAAAQQQGAEPYAGPRDYSGTADYAGTRAYADTGTYSGTGTGTGTGMYSGTGDYGDTGAGTGTYSGTGDYGGTGDYTGTSGETDTRYHGTTGDTGTRGETAGQPAGDGYDERRNPQQTSATTAYPAGPGEANDDLYRQQSGGYGSGTGRPGGNDPAQP